MTGRPDHSPERSERSPFTRGGFIAAAAFLALVVAGAVAVAATGGQHPAPARAPAADSPAPAASSPTGSSASGAASPVAGGCHPSDTSQQIPQAAPAVTWSVFKTVAVPSSATAGPMLIEGQMARCFARTPAGALIATWQIYVRSLLSDQWRQVTDAQVMPGPGRDAYVKIRSAYTGDASDPGVYGQMAGFKFAAYSADIAVIQIITRFSDGTLQVGTATVIWSGGDWRLQLQPGGAAAVSVQSVDSLDGFIPWGGV